MPFLATFVVMMLAADDGPRRVLIFLLLTVVSDTGAYAVGWRFGKHKLAPRISPGKTREGLLGAVAFAMVAGALCMQFLIDDGRWWQGLLLGLAVAVSATLGDLGESMIKRDLGIKDMGTLLPGHGGIMDRLDSLLPTAPVVWLLLVVFVGRRLTCRRPRVPGAALSTGRRALPYVCDTGRTMPKPGELTFVAPRGAKKPPRHLADLTPAERKEAVAALGEKPFRAKQLSQHYFARYADDPAAVDRHPGGRAREARRPSCCRS